MKRRLVKQGAATMMISLPTKWIKENNLGKGDEIDLVEEGNNLKIEASAKQEEGEIKETYNLSNFDPLINRALISLYIRGVDEIELIFSNADEQKKLKRQVINELIGFEIINQTQTKVLIKDVTGIDNQDADILIKRIFFILDSMSEELINAIEKKQDAFSVVETDSNVNKFVNFCLRLLNKKGYKNYSNIKNVYSIVSSFEEIGDIYKRIALEKIKVDKKQIELILECKNLLKIFEKLFFDFTRDNAKELARKFEFINKKADTKNIIDLSILSLAERIIRMNNELFIMSFK